MGLFSAPWRSWLAWHVGLHTCHQQQASAPHPPGPDGWATAPSSESVSAARPDSSPVPQLPLVAPIMGFVNARSLVVAASEVRSYTEKLEAFRSDGPTAPSLLLRLSKTAQVVR